MRLTLLYFYVGYTKIKRSIFIGIYNNINKNYRRHQVLFKQLFYFCPMAYVFAEIKTTPRRSTEAIYDLPTQSLQLFLAAYSFHAHLTN